MTFKAPIGKRKMAVSRKAPNILGMRESTLFSQAVVDKNDEKYFLSQHIKMTTERLRSS